MAEGRTDMTALRQQWLDYLRAAPPPHELVRAGADDEAVVAAESDEQSDAEG